MTERPTPDVKRMGAVTICRNGYVEELERQLAEAKGQRDRLTEVIRAATVLIAAKGRHNTMLAYEGLRDALKLSKPTT